LNDFTPARSVDAATREHDPVAPEQLVLDLDGYEGPIDLLLSLARSQKLDLGKISILALADQYLDFIARRRRLDLEVAADYLVMAAVLAYLKSCLLLPPPPKEDEPSAAELADILRHRLALLQAMQDAGRRLLARPLFGRDFFFRGAVEETAITSTPHWEIGLYALLRAYGERCQRRAARVLTIERCAFYSMDEALQRLARFLGRVANWRELSSFLPAAPGGEEHRRSAVASTFAAVLELARSGQMELRQDRPFGPIWLRSEAGAASR
jgi:segregation and condensation protein A